MHTLHMHKVRMHTLHIGIICELSYLYIGISLDAFKIFFLNTNC